MDLHKAAKPQLVKVNAEIEQHRLCSSVNEKLILHQLAVVVGMLLDTYLFAGHFGSTQSSETTAREG